VRRAGIEVAGSRRAFIEQVGAASLGLALPWHGRGGVASRSHQDILRVNGPRLNGTLDALARFGATPEGGTNRLAYSDDDLAAREFVTDLMGQAGLDVTVDLAGNLLGRRAGRDTSLPPLLMGSHIDSVPQGGSYDGQVGSMGAIEVVRSLDEARVSTRHPLEVFIFQNEEGGKTGSRALSGEVEGFELDIETASGFTIGEGIRRLGGDPSRLAEVRRVPGAAAAYLELHIEQGAILDRIGISIGIVEGIVGIKRWNVAVEGFANHAGTTPMSDRRDALVAAGRFIDQVNEVARTMDGRQVATVGRIEAYPGAPNVVPGRVELSLEIRDLTMDKIDLVFAEIERRATSIGVATGTTFEFSQFYVSRAAPTDERLQRLCSEAADLLELSHRAMPSGAGHDAQSIALFAPIGMIFVPSVGGVSHSPREFTRPAHIEAGANVLLQALLGADSRSWV
jgi:beta-ureidopropionase / N-carbamoyl-L-amino-acid hydrolase